jgi:hypothetical protein
MSRLSDAPVVTGEVNGGRQQIVGDNYEKRGIDQLPDHDTIFQSFNTDGDTASAQLIVSELDNQAPSPDVIRDIYKSGDGEFNTTYHPDVSSISAYWD